ncbi:MAG: response regulator transcription factor [Ardenticatenaceae bacterium]|nr:response regulator transcription factor [Anaerolineales bacterium]MCB9010072.1 response regulator transcription factor [Ardenticatenaceae bacterium]
MFMRLLLVEDESSIANFIRQGLTEAGYAVDVAQDGQEGLDYIRAADYDVLILDIMLPRLDGVTLLRQLRAKGNKTPALMLTARDTVDNRVEGLDAGADDYLVKPFAFPELLARVRALLRRPPLQAGTVLQIDNLQMDTAKHTVERNGRLIDLSPREYAVLEYLMRHPNQVLSRTQIGEHVWNFDFYNESNVVDVYIGYLRRKVDKPGELSLIHTVRGVGYCLRAEM